MDVNPDHLEGEQDPMTPGERKFLVIFCVLLFGLFAGDVAYDFSPVKLAVLFFCVAWFPLVMLHEFGHAWMARAFGWRVYEVVIGFGRVVKRWRWKGARVEIRAFPLGGHVVPVPRSLKGARLANFFVYAAGPGVELLVVGAMVLLFGYDTLTTSTENIPIIAVQAVCAAALTGAITNLMPLSTREGAWTDGKGMLMSPFMADAHFDRQMASPYIIEGSRRLDEEDWEGAIDVFASGVEKYPDVVLLHVGRARGLIGNGERSEALMYLQTAATDPDRSPELSRQLEVVLDHLRQEA